MRNSKTHSVTVKKKLAKCQTVFKVGGELKNKVNLAPTLKDLFVVLDEIFDK